MMILLLLLLLLLLIGPLGTQHAERLGTNPGARSQRRQRRSLVDSNHIGTANTANAATATASIRDRSGSGRALSAAQSIPAAATTEVDDHITLNANNEWHEKQHISHRFSEETAKNY